MGSKYYKDLTIDEKINAKSWGFWRLPSNGGYMLTMIGNADSHKREDYADFTKHHLVQRHHYAAPKNGNGIVNVRF